MVKAEPDLDVELSKLSVENLAAEEAVPDTDVLAEIAKELDERPNPTRVTSARPKKPPTASLTGEPGAQPGPGGATAGPVPPGPGGPGPAAPRRNPLKPKEDDISAEVQPSVEGDQVFEVQNGQASARVSDRLETRAVFLFYSNSNYKPNEMHRMTFNVPYLKAEQLLLMCHDLELIEPKGPLSKMALGITYATNKCESDPGLSYATFLDVLLELAFECGRNIGGQIVATHAKREAMALTKSTQRLNPMSETGLLRASMRSTQSILRGFSESGFKNTSRSDPSSTSQAGAPMLAPGMSFRSRFSDCGKGCVDGPDGRPGRSSSVGKTGRLHDLSEQEPDTTSELLQPANPWGRFQDGELRPHPPNMTNDGRSRAAIREARKLRPSMSGAVNSWTAVDVDGVVQMATTMTRSADAHPLHAAAFRPPAINPSPTGTLGRSPSMTRTSRFSKCGAEGEWPVQASGSGHVSGSGQEDGHDTGTSSPLTWSTDTSVTSPSSVLPRPPGSRPSSGLKSPQVSVRPPSAIPKDGPLSAAPPVVAVRNA